MMDSMIPPLFRNPMPLPIIKRAATSWKCLFCDHTNPPINATCWNCLLSPQQAEEVIQFVDITPAEVDEIVEAIQSKDHLGG